MSTLPFARAEVSCQSSVVSGLAARAASLVDHFDLLVDYVFGEAIDRDAASNVTLSRVASLV
jgi:hypothetical protein